MPSGGTISNSGGYRIHTFNSSGNFVVPATLSNVEYLVIAGGGAGGSYGAGGGSGGYRTSVVGQTSGGGASAESRLSVSAATYAITVGAGGAGATFEMDYRQMVVIVFSILPCWWGVLDCMSIVEVLVQMLVLILTMIE